MTLRKLFLAAIPLAALTMAGCDVDVNDTGELPDADVQVDPGRAPDVDVHGPDVDVQSREREVEVPDVDVDTERRTITVPDVNVDVPEENEN